MAWSTSAIFRQYVADMVQNTAAFDLDTDVPKVALYDNSITPDKDVLATPSAYAGAGAVWSATGGGTGTPQVFQAGQWAQGGVALASFAVTTPTTGVVMYDAADTASGSAATLANVFGVLVYDDTLTTPVADQGLCYNYLGGTNSVSGGTFTVVWNTSGIMRFTV
jgi:hypothetical protein